MAHPGLPWALGREPHTEGYQVGCHLSLQFTSLDIAGNQDMAGGKQEPLVFYDLRFLCNALLVTFLTIMVAQIHYEVTVTIGCDERGPENGHVDSLLLFHFPWSFSISQPHCSFLVKANTMAS